MRPDALPLPRLSLRPHAVDKDLGSRLSHPQRQRVPVRSAKGTALAMAR